MKTELTSLIKNNYKNLSEEEIELLANQMCAVLPKKLHKLCEIKVGDKFKYSGYEFTKLVDEENSCYCIMDNTVFESKFGENNDWAKSPIRNELNEFDDKGNSKAIKGIAKRDLVEVSLNYTAYEIPNGRTKDMITCLSYEEYLAYGFSNIDKDFWLRSGGYYNYSYALVVNSSGAYDGYYVTGALGVRATLHFRKDLEVEV